MKMLIILGLREDETRITGLIKEAGITMYSRFDTIGSVSNDRASLSDEWFAATDGQTNSVAYFSFAEDQKALKALALVRREKDGDQAQNPVHGFVLPVEAHY